MSAYTSVKVRADQDYYGPGGAATPSAANVSSSSIKVVRLELLTRLIDEVRNEQLHSKDANDDCFNQRQQKSYNNTDNWHHKHHKKRHEVNSRGIYHHGSSKHKKGMIYQDHSSNP